jgi:hypothetical protein
VTCTENVYDVGGASSTDNDDGDTNEPTAVVDDSRDVVGSLSSIKSVIFEGVPITAFPVTAVNPSTASLQGSFTALFTSWMVRFTAACPGRNWTTLGNAVANADVVAFDADHNTDTVTSMVPALPKYRNTGMLIVTASSLTDMVDTPNTNVPAQAVSFACATQFAVTLHAGPENPGLQSLLWCHNQNAVSWRNTATSKQQRKGSNHVPTAVCAVPKARTMQTIGANGA